MQQKHLHQQYWCLLQKRWKALVKKEEYGTSMKNAHIGHNYIQSTQMCYLSVRFVKRQIAKHQKHLLNVR